MNSMDRFEEKQLPDIKKFYSTLTDENISVEDYKFAQDILRKFNLKNLGEYHDIYLETDVMLIADVFETFRRSIMKKYKLDPAHFLTAQGLSWVACLKMTKVKLELLTHPGMSMFIDMAMLGGFSAVLFPFAKANNVNCGIYKPSLPFQWILYVDANNLYGWAMMQYLPTSSFKWVDVKERENWGEFILEQEDEQEDGYMLEVILSILKNYMMHMIVSLVHLRKW